MMMTTMSTFAGRKNAPQEVQLTMSSLKRIPTKFLSLNNDTYDVILLDMNFSKDTTSARRLSMACPNQGKRIRCRG